MEGRMSRIVWLATVFFGLWVVVCCLQPASAAVNIGTGNASLIGGDLTDPEDDVVDRGGYDADKSEAEFRPEKGNWVTMKSSPNSPPDKPAHQRHAYQDWQNSPPCAIFLNHPENRKWYLGFLDGGNGGPTEEVPYYCAVELKDPVALTHFTITTSPDMPDRDPMKWGIQGSETGKDGDWKDIYKCDAKDRSGTLFQEDTRTTTFLLTSFTSSNMAAICTPADAKKVKAKLGAQKIEKEDFPVQAKAYKWFRVVIYSCFNENSLTYEDFNRPPGFTLGQLELFGTALKGGEAKPAAAKKPDTPVTAQPKASGHAE